jgi:hypothetical protein
MNLNVTDLRTKKRRSLKNQKKEEKIIKEDRRKTRDRRIVSAAGSSETEDSVQRIWLTPGERTLIEDLYLLDDGNKTE